MKTLSLMLGILCSTVVGAQNGNLMVFPANKEVEQRYTILNSSNDVMRLGKEWQCVTKKQIS